MNDSIKKVFNALFRTVIFCCLVASVMMTVTFVRLAMGAEESGSLNEDIANALITYASLYKGIFYASIACIVLSLLSGTYKSSGAAVFFRTAMLGSMTINMSRGLAAVNAISEMSTVLTKIDIEDYDDITEEMFTDAGMTEARAEELVETLNSDGAVIAIVTSFFVCIAVYFLLSCTSLHNLLKKPKAADCGGCDDAQRVEMYDPAMLNGGSHYAGQVQQPQYSQQYGGINPSGVNRMNAVPPMAQNPYIQNIINAANAAHPAHDHHDSAEAHDLSAEGEFHDYARAEADMTDDSSDYISQLQREENNGHRVTDEDFM